MKRPRHIRRYAIGAVTAGIVAATAVGAEATHGGAVGKITYNVGTSIMIANPDGTGGKTIAEGTSGKWSPDGSRLAFVAPGGGIKSVRQDGGRQVTITTNPVDRDPVWNPTGDAVYFSRDGKLFIASSDGSRYEKPINENPDPATIQDTMPSVSMTRDGGGDDYDILFFVRRQNGGAPAIYRFTPVQQTPSLLIANATLPDVDPNFTKFAYVVPSSTPGAGDAELWTANLDGSGKQKIVTLPAPEVGSIAWSPDGLNILVAPAMQSVTPVMVRTVNVAAKTIAPLVEGHGVVAAQAVQTNIVQRVWGDDGILTAIATAKRNFGDGQAGAVVLSRSDTYLDALVGSALAINKGGPLLITAPGSTVEPRVVGEIQRVLGASGDIYLLGGVLALPQGIEDQLKGLGYTVHRIWGANHYATAVAINKEITTDPTAVIVTTGANYYDALAAGAAAGANPGTVVVLSDGGTMPAVSAEYMNSIGPGPTVVTAGGPGDAALRKAAATGQLPAWGNFTYTSLVGANEKDTAVALARQFFVAPRNVAISTNRGWQDALTGGAMIGGTDGPLLLTDPDALYGPVANYLSDASGSIYYGVVLGGKLALPATIEAPIGNAIGVTGSYAVTGSASPMANLVPDGEPLKQR
ncbi:cell wall-binding repeat-containing protein [Dactylosporangium aurantiacum]|uniref:Cell wall-binding repeat-containing protein n=1 Tax=Dactylosporangium aurantiacum TaxID=35754 RepID=A0A9Q9IJ41_9ACTN|nr:cell wall-binding repeat-containing protein [Dactylosporangium aurantiacum]MDG6100856.1 cell wall-binding repeat-containing protein [Dactylosporangium aurantiacum]UWZ55085.1 cell wall-binding repeat-containing protein [Dactylosporangium aurantiacum]